MTRVVSVGRSKSLLAAGAIGFAFASIALTGCPGTLDPSFNMMASGAAGSSGTGNTGAAGAASGMAGATTMGCDITPLIQGNGTGATPAKYYCIQTGACHDGSASTAAGFSMLPADWPKLVGKMPTSPVVNGGICGGDATYMKVPYIIKGGNGDGLIMQKLSGAICSPGGQKMPTLGGTPTAAEKMCFQQWAAALAAMPYPTSTDPLSPLPLTGVVVP
jgi:hypothetical protein